LGAGVGFLVGSGGPSVMIAFIIFVGLMLISIWKEKFLTVNLIFFCLSLVGLEGLHCSLDCLIITSVYVWTRVMLQVNFTLFKVMEVVVLEVNNLLLSKRAKDAPPDLVFTAAP